jgi:hypothetical protein
MEAKCSSEISVHFQRTARPYIAEDRNLHIGYYDRKTSSVCLTKNPVVTSATEMSNLGFCEIIFMKLMIVTGFLKANMRFLA